MSLPVIFLAFANNNSPEGEYLIGLTREQTGILEALELAKEEKLCEIICETNVTIERIIDLFQDKLYRDRIAIFHYAGHAGSTELLLESINGNPQAFKGENLANILGRRSSLSLIFLNGCSTEWTAIKLNNAGVPLVIGTLEEVGDRTSAELAIKFYNGLGKGMDIDQAWMDAENVILGSMTEGEGYNYRNVYNQQIRSIPNQFPWKLHYRSGAEHIRNWNLPQAARNPLFGMPKIPEKYYQQLPVSPFLSLQSFRREQAGIFFGRPNELRELYNKIQGHNSIILYYGPSGVGKTSLLDAGLVPRMEEQYTVIIKTRIPECTLTGTIRQALAEHLSIEQGQEDVDFLWEKTEEQHQRPILFIFDQFEEVFTKPSVLLKIEEDFAELCATLALLFDQKQEKLKGKIIFSYREEYHARIESTLQAFSLPFISIYLKPLDKLGIVEAITGVAKQAQTQKRYKLRILEEQNGALASSIADDLMEDNQSTLAPVLQILLEKMWVHAQNQATDVPTFTVELYGRLKREGYLLRDFFDQQMKQLEIWRKDLVASGLVLDILHYFTTSQGTTCSQTLHDINTRYIHQADVVPEILQHCIDLYFLQQSEGGSFRLNHDTLAVLVRYRHEISGYPGQLASRVLANKSGENTENVILDNHDLKIVESGLSGRSDCSEEEKLLITRSQKAREARQKAVRMRWTIAISGVSIVLLLLIVSVFLWRTSEKKRLEAQTQLLISKAQETYPTNFSHSIGLLKKVYELNQGNPPTEAKLALSSFFYTNDTSLIAKSEMLHKSIVLGAKSYPDENLILTWTMDGEVKLWDLDGKLKSAMQHDFYVNDATLSSDKKMILTCSSDATARLWDINGKLLAKMAHQGRVDQAVFLQNDKIISTYSYDDQAARLWTIKGEAIAKLPHSESNELSVINKRKGLFLTSSSNGIIKLWNVHNQRAIQIDHKDTLTQVLVGKNGSHLVSWSKKQIKIWKVTGEIINLIQTKSTINDVVLSSDQKSIIGCFKNGEVKVMDFNGNVVTKIMHESSAIGAKKIKTRIISWSTEGEIKISNSEGKLIDHNKAEGGIDSVKICESGAYLISWNKNGDSYNIWNFKTKKVMKIEENMSSPFSIKLSQSLIMIAQNGNIINLFNKNGKKTGTLHHNNFVRGMEFMGKGDNILSWSHDETAKIWLSRREKIKQLNGARAYKDFFQSKNHICAFSERGIVDLFDNSFKKIKTFNHFEKIDGVFMSKNEKYLITWTNNRMIKLWKVNGQLVKTIKGHTGWLIENSYLPTDEKSIYYWFSNSTFRKIYDARMAKSTDLYAKIFNDRQNFSIRTSDSITTWDHTGNKIYRIRDTYLSEIEFNDRRKLMLFHGYNKKRNYIKLVDYKGKEISTMFHDDGINGASFNRNGDAVLSWSEDKTIRIWNLNGGLIQKIQDRWPIHFAQFSPDEKKIQYINWEQKAKVCDLKGKIMMVVNEVDDAQFSPDGTYILLRLDEGNEVRRLDGKIILQMKAFPVKFSTNGKYIIGMDQEKIKLWPLPQTIFYSLKTSKVGDLPESVLKKYLGQ